jgi:multidrug efflux pump subunit AcrB
MTDTRKRFWLSSWAIDNRSTIFVITVVITLWGFLAYRAIPKEAFPDIVIPTIYINTVYPGSSPADIESIITKPVEKELKSISGVKKVTSNSIQDFSIIIVEFNTDVGVQVAKQKVKDAVDRARGDLPSDLPMEPIVMEIEFSEFPILNIHLSGEYDLMELNRYAEALQERIETLREIKRADIVGAPEREVQVNVDMYKMQAASVSLQDIQNAIAFENLNVSGGTVNTGEMKRTLNINGEFESADQIGGLIINSMMGRPVYLRDIAQVVDTVKERESYARFNGLNVITLSIIKRGGENLILAADEIREIIADMRATKTFPENLKVDITDDQSRQTRTTLHDLINTIIIGFILVTIVLMFFMGATNAMFVALSVPLSMCLAFMVLPWIGFTLNMIVLFSFLLGLGIVVDDAIVVIENTHRIYGNGKMPIVEAAKNAAGEVFLPVLSGTLTTLAPFIPLAFWEGIIGEFMRYLPITLIITLTASLVVAYVINPVLAVRFMKPHTSDDQGARARLRKLRWPLLGLLILALLSYLFGGIGVGNFFISIILLVLLYHLLLTRLVRRFQERAWPAFRNWYGKRLRYALKRPGLMIFGTLGLFIVSVILLIARSPKMIFFPQGDPNSAYAYVTLPTGTDPAYTDSVARIVEGRVSQVLGKDNPLIESVISNVGLGASEEMFDRGQQAHKAKITVGFVEYAKRGGASTAPYLDSIRNALKDIPGAEFTVGQEQNGPPTSKPINIEIIGEDFAVLMKASEDMKYYLDSLQIDGVEDLKTDLVLSKPEIVFDIDRERANRENISTGVIGMEIRTAVLGREVSRFKDVNDDYPIQLRYLPEQRNNIDALRNLTLTYRDMNMNGMMRQVPISAFADVQYSETYGGIKRKNQKRVVTISSNVLPGFNPNTVVAEVRAALDGYEAPEGVTVDMTGEQEEQAETSRFLGRAMLISLALMVIILVTQFNSISKPIIILTEVFFSVIGVLLGYALTGMEFSIVMTGVGIVALSGIVVRNGILLVEFTDVLRKQGMPLMEALVEAGRTRMTPVLLTATAAILGMIPLAVGLNIDFETLFTELDPNIYFGGDNVVFWGPLSWTIIFGLGFATVITLIIVPVLYLLAERAKKGVRRAIGKEAAPA